MKEWLKEQAIATAGMLAVLGIMNGITTLALIIFGLA